ncbi:S8 family serine peptidase [candidate division KSB1 bacterium]|nr:S8 family serine peptidase [candidate division KSB1 bacterium]
MKFSHREFLWVWLGLGVLYTVGLAAEFSPTLDKELKTAGKNDWVSAVVILESPIDIRTLDSRLHDQRAPLAQRNREVLAALKYNAELTQPPFQAELDEAKGNGLVVGYTSYWIENLLVIEGTAAYIESLRSRGDIRYVCENFRPELIEPIRTPLKPGESVRPPRNPLDTMTLPPGIIAVGAYRVNTELGITGNGVLVANLDTGVDGNHAALASRWRGLFAPAAECWRDALGGGTSFPSDGYGHGTHVMGTMAGRAIVGSDTQWVGCAPAARWIADNAINQGVGGGFDNDIIDAFQWFANPDGNINTVDDVPDVIQNSWGVNTGLGYVQCFDYWNTVILNCEAAGPVVTWSAGNESTSGLRSPAIYSINDYQIFSVAAVDAGDATPPYPLASFSSQGPTPCTPAVPDNIKPEIAAPGVNVYSSVPGGGYDGTYSGTSMAGPHVAGVVALMREACPDCDHQTIKQAIMSTALDQGAVGQDNQYGYGFIDGYLAVLSVSNLGRIAGVVVDGSSAPLSGVKVKNAAGTQEATTDASGQYYLPLQAGTYAIEYSKFGYLAQTIPGLTVVTGDTTIQNITLLTAPSGNVSGTVTSCFGGPAIGATVEVLGTPVTPATTNGSGFYSITLPQGTYDMRASGGGCGQVTVTGVVVGASANQDFTLPTDPRYSCSELDADQYSACEVGDGGGPVYTWYEIAPLAGGPGTASSLTTDDQSANFALPITFRFHGTNYSSVNICTNGFASFTSTATAYINEGLPSASIGAALCPLWDDLLPSGSTQIATYYHAGESAFIIEWYNIGHYSGGGVETFQIWLFDVGLGGGPGGNSRVLMQYSAVGNSASATVGQAGLSVGTQYQFDATLDASSQGLANNWSIAYGQSCAGAAEIDGLPLSVSALAPLGGGDTVTVQVCNLGTCPLSYSLSFTQTTPLSIPGYGYLPTLSAPAPAELEPLSKTDPEPRGRDQLDNTGSDAFGYVWLDTAEPGGPAFNWFNISGVGTNANMAYDDRCVRFALPFNFLFYGASYDSVYICSNGNLQFTGPDTAYGNRTIPTAATPNSFIAPFWDDMDLETRGAIYYYDDAANGRFIVQWDSVYKWSGTGPFWFQVIVEPCGDITIMHERMNGLLNSATVGIENQTGTVGSLVVYNGTYITNNNAIKFTYPDTPWLASISPASGTVSPSACQTVELHFSAICLPTGVYQGTLTVGNNDADENPTVIPVQFTVGQLDPPQQLTLFYLPGANQLRFNWVGSGAPQYKVLSSTSPDGPFDTVIGTTTGTQLDVPFAGTQRLFYVVVATDGAGASSRPSLPAGGTIR